MVSLLSASSNAGELHRVTNSGEVDDVLNAARNATPHIDLFALLGITRGLRRGEICGLCWDDIDFETKQIRINHNLIESSTYGVDGTPITELVLKEPKSVTSRRTLTLSADLERALKRVKSEQSQNRLSSPDPWPEERYVFTAKNGNPVWPRNLGRSFRRFLKREGLPHVGVHDLRRTCANTASQAGVPIEEISELLGHASIGITKSLYIGQVEVLALRACSAIDEYLDPTYPTPRIVGRP